MAKKNYENMWHELKDELISDFYKETERLERVSKNPNNKISAYIHGRVEGQRNQTLSHLMRMEDLDGTYYFKNLLHDMNRSE
ncbi:hypothetical protein PYH58_08140 [Mammaliicoccus sciuri]|uniref:hypothetical protein n=1 Tax=Mammaliicoccus sciuri TaxID=1296 RepID=UPI003365249C